MKTPVKVSMKVQRIAEALSRVSIQNVNQLQVHFCGIRSSLISFWQGACSILNKKYHVSVYFLRNVISLSLICRPGKKYHVYGKKIPPFQIVQERSYPSAILFGKIIFSEHLKKISYFRVFFLERLSFIFRLVVRSYFREKEISSFPIIQERSYSSAICLERPSFQDAWKKKMWFSVQCKSCDLLITLSRDKGKNHITAFAQYLQPPNLTEQ